MQRFACSSGKFVFCLSFGSTVNLLFIILILQFLGSLKDNLNAEVALGTVTNVKEACAWLGYTYLFIRMRTNPLVYGIAWEEVNFFSTIHIFNANRYSNIDLSMKDAFCSMQFVICPLSSMNSMQYLCIVSAQICDK